MSVREKWEARSFNLRMAVISCRLRLQSIQSAGPSQLGSFTSPEEPLYNYSTTFIKTDPLQHYKVLMQCQARPTNSRTLAVDFYQRVNYVFINIIKVDKRKRDIFFDK